MKLTHIISIIALSIGASAANASLLSISGGNTLPVPTNNNFLAENDLAAGQNYNVGGNLIANVALKIEYVYLGHEANFNNHFTVGASDISTSAQAAFLKCTNHTCDADTPKNKVSYQAPTIASSAMAGDLLNFSFWTQTNKNLVKSVANGSNTWNEAAYNYAVALNVPFKQMLYDAILFLDDTGKNNKGVDDNDHDDMVIGLRVFALPEPSALLLIGLGLFGLAASRRLQGA